ncbi:hypothetical protein [Flavihumibacter sp. CACIAM 22H1]|uniref:DUF5018-related domain-containing protein n=1 Tax=Flavihumibacter sp. CACIAM 22H1 TaxID=1812911 RepID=UPI0007A8FABE|nr:hypothetical protein [Flavihumibacter sp. CACIAM 22H1]KYP15993.1 MAG: hypothetical protein A1D16_06955 [Flavihumibacter sp. CACIAM 22H1]
MKVQYSVGIILLMFVAFSSCLKRGLDELPTFSDTKIDRFDFEYRWNDNGTFRVVRFNTNSTIENDNITVTTTVPAASGSFTSQVRNEITLSNIVGMCNISTAATIKPVDGAPELGVPGNYSKNVSYEVTAADGRTKKRWNVVVNLIK